MKEVMIVNNDINKTRQLIEGAFEYMQVQVLVTVPNILD